MRILRRRRRPEASGTLRLGDHSADEADYAVYAVSESRHPGTFDGLWAAATDDERRAGRLRRWATVVPVRDPKYGVADLAVQFDGRVGCFLRPPHLGRLAERIEQENVTTLELPALVERGPAGPTVRLLVSDDPVGSD